MDGYCGSEQHDYTFHLIRLPFSKIPKDQSDLLDRHGRLEVSACLSRLPALWADTQVAAAASAEDESRLTQRWIQREILKKRRPASLSERSQVRGTDRRLLLSP